MKNTTEVTRSVPAEEQELFGATVDKLSIQPGDIVKLNIPKVGNRWGIPRIHKLAAAVRNRGGELVVIQEGTTLEIETK